MRHIPPYTALSENIIDILVPILENTIHRLGDTRYKNLPEKSVFITYYSGFIRPENGSGLITGEILSHVYDTIGGGYIDMDREEYFGYLVLTYLIFDDGEFYSIGEIDHISRSTLFSYVTWLLGHPSIIRDIIAIIGSQIEDDYPRKTFTRILSLPILPHESIQEARNETVGKMYVIIDNTNNQK